MGEEKKDDRTSTVRGRELGAALRRALTQSDYGTGTLARKLHWSPAKVSNLLAGKRGTSEADIAAFLALCGVAGKERDHLLRLCREFNEQGYLQSYGTYLATLQPGLIDHEDLAITFSEYHTQVIPGLLQTAEYASALLRASANIPKAQVEARVAVRMTRQQSLTRRDPAQFTFLIDEHVLRRTGPGAGVMSAQLHHLLRMAVRPNITIRVIPDSVGFHAGINPFVLFTFSGIAPVIFVEGECFNLFLEQRDEVAAYQNATRALTDAALDEGRSRELIAHLAVSLSIPNEEHNDLV